MGRKLGNISGVVLISSAVLAKYLLIVPEYVIKYVGNSAWIVILAKYLISNISLILILKLYKPFGNTSLDKIFYMCGGKTGKIIFSYFYTFVFTLFNALLLRLLCEALSTCMTPSAPDEYFALFVLCAVFFGAYYGITASADLSICIFPLVIFTTVLLCVILFPHYKADNIMPLLGNGVRPLLKSIFIKHFGFSEIILLFFYADHFSSFKDMKKVGFRSLFVVGLFVTLFTLSYCLSFPYPASGSFFLPLYQMTRLIKASSFLQRLEPLSVFIWTGFILCSMCALVSLSSKLLAGTKKHEKGFVPIIVIITFFIAMLPSSEMQAYIAYEKMLEASTLLFPTIPFIVLIAAGYKRRKQK